MPKSIDHSLNPKSEWDTEANLAEPVYGQGESPLYFERDSYFKDTGLKHPERLIIMPQFDLRYRDDQPFVQWRDDIFDWLEKKTTGPWYMHEGWTNHGHSLALYVWIERHSDRKNFSKVFGPNVSWHDTDDVQTLAIAKGIVPEITADE